MVLELLVKVARFDRPLKSGNAVKKSYQSADSLYPVSWCRFNFLGELIEVKEDCKLPFKDHLVILDEFCNDHADIKCKLGQQVRQLFFFI